MATPPFGAVKWTVASSLGVLLLLPGCTSDDPGADPADDPGAAMSATTVKVRDVACPGAVPTVSTPLAGLREVADFEAYLLDPEEDLGDDNSGTYCLQVAALENFPSAPTKLTFEAGKDSENYGESYTTSDPEGSDEITNFPFSVGVYGECRPVSATLTLANGKVHTARMRIGAGCPDT